MSANHIISNPGQPMTAAMHYGRTMILYTAMERIATVVDGAPPGPTGRLFIVDIDEPTEVPWEAGRFILEHLAYTGVVQVEETVTVDDKGRRRGTDYDLEGARQRSLELCKRFDQERWTRFVNDMMTDYVSRKDGKQLAVPAPPAAILAIMERRGYKLQDYGIKPMGFEDPNATSHVQIKEENATLRKELAALTKRMNKLEK